MKWREVGPYLKRALAPARWPDELEKPDPGFRRPRLAGRARFRAVGLGRVSRRAIRRRASAAATLFSSPLWGGPDGALYTVPFRRLTNIRFSFWSNTTPQISSMLWSSGTTLRPSLSSCSAALFPVTIWRVWLEGRRRDFAPFAKLPPWPLDPKQKAPAIVIGEVHHPVEAREVFNPSWLTIPERGLYTGVAIFGAVGSGKTSACWPLRPLNLPDRTGSGDHKGLSGTQRRIPLRICTLIVRDGVPDEKSPRS